MKKGSWTYMEKGNHQRWHCEECEFKTDCREDLIEHNQKEHEVEKPVRRG